MLKAAVGWLDEVEPPSGFTPKRYLFCAGNIVLRKFTRDVYLFDGEESRNLLIFRAEYKRNYCSRCSTQNPFVVVPYFTGGCLYQ